MTAKQDGRGRHGKTGRKATGRVRNKVFPGKFSQAELDEIKEKAKEYKETQSDVVLTGIRKLEKK